MMATFLVAGYLTVAWILAIITYIFRDKFSDDELVLLMMFPIMVWPVLITLWVLFLVSIYLPSRVVDYVSSKYSKVK